MVNKTDIPAILKENKRRMDILFSPYDPVIGIGSPLERFKLTVSKDNFLYLPMEMKPFVEDALKAGSVLEMINRDEGVTDKATGVKDYLNNLNTVRVRYDFEFWAITCVKLWDKITKEVKAFRLRIPQREALVILEGDRLAGVPIRLIIVKARQWGGSTLVQIYSAWIQLFHKTSWHSAIVADVDDQARNIRGMFTRFAKSHPSDIMDITFKPYEGSQKTRIIEERDCIIGVGSVTHPENLRSYDFMMCHMSEVAFWKSSVIQSAESLAQSIRGSIPYEPYTLIALESTAKGVGNFFHREWVSAVDGKSAYHPLFIPWHGIEIYTRKIEDYPAFIATMGDYDWFCWEKGATLEGINWYKTYKAAENRDELSMNQEFPTTAEEAFQSTGRRAFSPIYVLRARVNCMPPVFIGEIEGDAVKGKDAFRNLRLVKNPKGNLWIWMMPDGDIRMSRRYCSFGDIGGRTKDADFSGLKVFDRYWMQEGGVPEVAAVWHGHLDQDLFAWKAAQLSYFYHKAHMAIETNSLRKESMGSEGEHYLTVLNEIAEYYDNLFTRIDPDRVREGVPVQYGFHTNVSTKPMIIDGLNGALRDTGYIERDSRACDEMDWYEIKEDGSYGAIDGKKDDHVIMTAGGVWLSYKMDPPVLIKEETAVPRKKKMTEATF